MSAVLLAVPCIPPLRPSSRRRSSLLVGPAGQVILELVVSLGDLHRQLGRSPGLLRRLMVKIGMVLAHELAIGRLDLLEVGTVGEVEDLVVLGDPVVAATDPGARPPPTGSGRGRRTTRAPPTCGCRTGR